MVELGDCYAKRKPGFISRESSLILRSETTSCACLGYMLYFIKTTGVGIFIPLVVSGGEEIYHDLAWRL